MGNKISSTFWRKVNRFNVENRAHRVLEKDPKPAPKFRSNEDDLRRTLEHFPDYLEKQNQKDSNLDERLKKVYVTSESQMIEREKIEPEAEEKSEDEKLNKKLPLDRSIVEDFEYGYMEPTKVPIGRCTLRQAMKFISDYQTEPTVWTPKRIADEYKLKTDRVEKILESFKTFQIYIPDKHVREKILTDGTKKIENKEESN